ncbi:MAG: cobalamin B12-binding domain-containing protein [Myxococcales bacterium]|nr:cobalamin B12-binding domain-containing protein [Myxococcales bacterium]
MNRLNVLNPTTPCADVHSAATVDLGGRAVVLVGLDWTRDKDPRIPLGQASIAASLRAAGARVHNLSCAINSGEFSLAAVVDEVLALAADGAGGWSDVGVGVYVWNDALVLALCRRLRERGYGGRIILGGPQITYHAPGVADSYPCADVFVRGAGEEAIVAILAEGGRARHPGVVWRGDEDLAEQASVTLERAPSPYLSGVLDPAACRRFLRWETKRGCPFRCSFCQHRDPGQRAQVRGFGSGRIAEEIAAFVDAGVESIAVLDPIFNDKRFPYLAVLDGLIEAGYRGRLSLQCRFEMVDPAFIERCRSLDVDLEFGLQTIHAAEWSVIRRGNHLGKIEAAIDALHAAGLRFEVSLIYGLPAQTLESFRATVDWCLRRRIPVIKAFPLMLLRGTELERRRAEWRLEESDDAIPMVVSSDTFTPQDHEAMGRIAEALVATEGAHPTAIDELFGGWSGPPMRTRWTPAEVHA